MSAPTLDSGSRWSIRGWSVVVAVAGVGCTGAGRSVGRGVVLSTGRSWPGISAKRLFRNLETVRGDIVLSAVTAPGAGELPWDESVCAGLGEHEHSGKLGCRVEHAAARAWNESAPDRWRRLHRRAYQDTVRRFGSGSVWMVARVWEMQARGVLHIHPVLAYGTPPADGRRLRLPGATG